MSVEETYCEELAAIVTKGSIIAIAADDAYFDFYLIQIIGIGAEKRQLRGLSQATEARDPTGSTVINDHLFLKGRTSLALAQHHRDGLWVGHKLESSSACRYCEIYLHKLVAKNMDKDGQQRPLLNLFCSCSKIS